jgi:hypothetical protein
MPRLYHSQLGFIRQMQASRYRLWMFVEGMSDRYFYDSLCRARPTQAAIPYWVALAHEIPGYRGNGKAAILGLYRWLRQTQRLVTVLGNRKTAVLCCLDKDIDEILRCRARSPHVVYTELFCVENYLFRHGDLCKAAQVAAQLDHASVQALVGNDQLQWSQRAADSWKEWVTFCVFVQQNGIGVRNFGIASQFQNGPYRAVVPTMRAVVMSACQVASGMNANAFAVAYANTEARVNKLYAKGQHDRVFNGKWYASFLAADAGRAAAGRQHQQRDLPERLTSTLAMSLDFSAGWAAHFLQAIDAVAQLTI